MAYNQPGGTAVIDVKCAIGKAKEYAQDILGEQDLLLEEIDSRDEYFEITLSFPARGARSLNQLLPVTQQQREYKSFRVRKSDGNVLGMWVRQIV